jgi:hypothetical protein
MRQRDETAKAANLVGKVSGAGPQQKEFFDESARQQGVYVNRCHTVVADDGYFCGRPVDLGTVHHERPPGIGYIML